MPNKKFGKKNERRPFFSKSKGKFSNRTNQQNSKEYRHQNQLQEADVGITEFISKLEGYSGVIKARYSDFQVNEIGLDGEAAKLTDLSIPPEFLIKKDENVGELSTDSPIEQIPQTTWDAIRKLIESPDESMDSVELDSSNLSKEDRTKIHDCIKDNLNSRVFANTVTNDGKKVMIFKKSDGKNNEDRRLKWPKNKAEYVHFLVYKESLDTLDASLKIATRLRMSPSHFTYAGVKDKRSKSTQWFCLRKVSPAWIVNRTKFLKNIKIGNFTFKNEPLKLGHLQGNKFRIALRNVTATDDLIEKSLKSLGEKGFINYYGLQRFGNNKEVPTFSVGVQLLLGNWKEACQIILKPTESDNPGFDVSEAKKVYQETGDASKALEKFEESRNTCNEYLLLAGLNKEHANDFVNALANIPRNTRLLYIHSFQSLVWNMVTSKRIEKFGLNVVEGDLILLEEQNEEKNPDDEEVEKRPKVKALTSDECGNYTIYDVVLPLPGYDIIYPEHLKEFYKETLEKYGLTLEMTKQKVQTYTLSGTYRKLLGQVKNLSWKIMHYNDPNHNLIRSDLEELQGQEEPEDLQDGTYKALVLEFSLNSASYATMVLREILKTDTSSSSHAKLNNYHVTTCREQDVVLEKDKEPDATSDKLDDRIGLLSDAAKYEQFKNIVFNAEETSLKRKYEQDAGEHENAKSAKTDDNDL